MKTPNKEDLFTARWHLRNEFPIPPGGPTESLLELLGTMLGPEPGKEDHESKVDLSEVVNGLNDGGGIVLVQDEDAPEDDDIAIDGIVPIENVPWLIGPGGSFPIVGQRFSPAEFHRYLHGIPDEAMTWDPVNITMHHTAAPSLAQRPAPEALTTQHMRNLRHYYHQRLGWSRGPHLFVDDNGIWVFSPLTHRGVHAKSFNRSHIGIEMLGNFDHEDPYSGRGFKVTRNSEDAAAALCQRFGFPVSGINGHRDDPRSSKTCPGRKFDLERFRSEVGEILPSLAHH